MKFSQDDRRPLLAIDPGLRYIGIAVSDAEQKHAFPKDVLQAEPQHKFWQQLAELIREHKVSTVLVGHPRSLKGKDLPMTKVAEKMAEEIKERFEVTVELVDERMSSVAAQKTLLQHYKSDQRVDAAAAALLLESYLAGRAHG